MVKAPTSTGRGDARYDVQLCSPGSRRAKKKRKRKTQKTDIYACLTLSQCLFVIGFSSAAAVLRITICSTSLGGFGSGTLDPRGHRM